MNRPDDSRVGGESQLSSDREYYHVEIRDGESGNKTWSIFSNWAGWERKTHLEIREGSLVNADVFMRMYAKRGVKCLVIHEMDQYIEWFFASGPALIESKFAMSVIPQLIAPHVVALEGYGAGYVDPALLPEGALHRKPNAKLRMAILNRDGFKCRICGRSPREHGDIELHVHHILPWAIGGLTHERNLASICSTCHRGAHQSDSTWDIAAVLRN